MEPILFTLTERRNWKFIYEYMLSDEEMHEIPNLANKRAGTNDFTKNGCIFERGSYTKNNVVGILAEYLEKKKLIHHLILKY